MDRQIESVLTCFHAYCKECINDWKQRDPTCPLCREAENGRGSFDMIQEPSMEEKEQIKLDLMRELSRIISELIGEKREELLFHQPSDDDKD